jgi:hypothetical protein
VFLGKYLGNEMGRVTDGAIKTAGPFSALASQVTRETAKNLNGGDLHISCP